MALLKVMLTHCKTFLQLAYNILILVILLIDKLLSFRTKTNEESGGWRKLYNEELYNLYFSLNVIKEKK
jgi:hypothetical protein